MKELKHITLIVIVLFAVICTMFDFKCGEKKEYLTCLESDGRGGCLKWESK